MSSARLFARRRFLRLAGLSALAAAAASAAGCGGQQNLPAPTGVPASTATPLSPTRTAQPPTLTPTPAQPGSITLEGGSAEVWAWSIHASGRVENLACNSVLLTVNQKPMPANLQNNTFSADLPLGEGENRVSASCQPAGEASLAEASMPVTYTGMLRDLPVSNIRILIDGERIILDGGPSQPAAQQPSPLVTYTWTARKSNPAPLEILEPPESRGSPLSAEQPLSGQTTLALAVPKPDGEYYLSLTVTDQAGRSDISTTYFVVSGGKARLDDWTWQNTAWVENAIVYGVTMPKFGRGGFQSVIDRLDKLQELGVNALWLSPVNVSPADDYGYAVVDYFNLRKAWGTKETFRKLVDEAHQRGIRVLMDFVANHSSDQHPYFVEAQASGKASHYWNFYDRDEQGGPTHYFTWENLPNFNYNNPEVQAMMTAAFAYWVREFDVDGFRVDAAWGVRQRNPEFWPKWRAALKRIKPDLLLLAEASARDAYYFSQGFDAAYDWTDALGKWAWESVFGNSKLLIYNLNVALTNNRKGFDKDALIFRFLNNNDTGDRFITQYGQPMNHAATVMLLTLPGIPCIYTGDEVGAEFSPYADEVPLSWDDRLNLFAEYKKLVGLRRDTPALHSRNWQIIEVEPHLQIYAYLRYTEDADGKPGEQALVLLNFMDKPAQAEVTLPEEFAGLAQKGRLRDLLSGQTIKVGKTLAVEMEPYGARVLAV